MIALALFVYAVTPVPRAALLGRRSTLAAAAGVFASPQFAHADEAAWSPGLSKELEGVAGSFVVT